MVINDWLDFVCVIGLDFLIIVIGTYILSRLPEHTRIYVALAILFSAIFFTRKLLNFIMEKLNKNSI